VLEEDGKRAPDAPAIEERCLNCIPLCMHMKFPYRYFGSTNMGEPHATDATYLSLRAALAPPPLYGGEKKSKELTVFEVKRVESNRLSNLKR